MGVVGRPPTIDAVAEALADISTALHHVAGVLHYDARHDGPDGSPRNTGQWRTCTKLGCRTMREAELLHWHAIEWARATAGVESK